MSAITWLKDWGSIVAAVIAALASIATLVLSTALTFRREKRKALWELELRRFMELEEAAGKLAEELLTYELRGASDGKERFWEQYAWLKTAAGRFRRYPAVRSALRDFNYAASSLFQVDRPGTSFKEYDKFDAEVESTFAALLRASDAATSRPKSDA